MHRHGYQGRKLGRERDERRNLIKGLANSLVLDEQITTTLPKAKEVLPYAEKLITKAKSATLADKRLVFARLVTKEAGHKLLDELAPKMSGRTSGHIRLVKAGLRKGDGAQMATLSFVDDFSEPKKPSAAKTSKTEATPKPKAPAKSKPAAKKPTKAEAKK